MKKLKLSARAWEILLVIDERSEIEPDGRYWLPGELRGTSDWCKRLGRHCNINGSGDARIFESLINKGLIVRPTCKTASLGKYPARITEDGRLLIEQSIENKSIPLQLRD